MECEGGCKTWVHLKCHKIVLGNDWFCDNCQHAVQSSKAPSDDLDDSMELGFRVNANAAGASPCDAPSSDALAGAAPRAEEGRAELGSPAGDLIGAAERPTIDKQGLRAAGSSPDGSSAAEDIELDLSPTASPAALTSGKKSKKVNNSVSSTKSGSHLH